jgi:L-fucose isomerase-like protein
MTLKIMPVFFKTENKEAKAIVESIKDLIPDHAELLNDTFVDRWEDLQDLQEKAARADIVLELSENIRLVPLHLFLRLGDLGLPIVLFGGECSPGARRLEAMGYWRAVGKKAFLPLTQRELSEGLALMTTKQRIEHTRALLLGSPFQSPYVVTSLPDSRVALRTLGVSVHSRDATGFSDRYKKVGEARVSRLATEWVTAAHRVIEPADADVHKSARFYLAIKDLIEEHGAGAFAVNCIPFLEEMGGTPCMALAKLNDEGIPSACEGDATALMTMIFLERLANRPTFMGNIIYANPIEDVIELNHCVLPFRMKGYHEPQEPYVLRDYHGRGFGVTASYDPGSGHPVTVARFDPSLRELVFTRGQLLGYGEDFCRHNLRVKIPDVTGFMRQVRGNHHVLVYGHYGERIVDLCAEFGIIPIAADSSSA